MSKIIDPYISNEDAKDLFSESSKKIYKALVAMASLGLVSLFCILTPDSNYFSYEQKIKFIFAELSLTMPLLILFCPLVLLFLSIYIHVYIEYQYKYIKAKEKVKLHYFFFNDSTIIVKLFSNFILYFYVPVLLLFLARKGTPFGFGSALYILFIASALFHFFLFIKRTIQTAEHTIKDLHKIILPLLFLILLSLDISFSISNTRSNNQNLTEEDTVLPTLMTFNRNLDLYKANLSHVDLREVNLQNANLKFANLQDALLEGANLNFSNLTGADLKGANLKRASLFNAILISADLTDADLSNANLNKADLSKAVMNDTNVSGTRMNNVVAEPASLQKTTNTKLAIGTIPFIASSRIKDQKKQASDITNYDKKLDLFKQFKLTQNYYSEKMNLDQIVKEEFGETALVADWNQLKEFSKNNKITSFMDYIGLSKYDEYILIKADGKYKIPKKKKRHYFFARHNGKLPQYGFLSHDNIDNFQATLGSWFGLRSRVLAFIPEDSGK